MQDNINNYKIRKSNDENDFILINKLMLTAEYPISKKFELQTFIKNEDILSY